MSNLRPFEIVPIPVAETPQSARDLLQEFACSALPALVIRNANPTDLQDAIAELDRDLPANMDTEAQTRDFEFGDLGELGHAGLHYDYGQPAAGAEKIPISYHLTHTGLAVASLFAIGPAFSERRADNTLPEKDARLLNFHDGYVDADVSGTVCHQTTLTAGSLLIFKNGAPYWHIMDTQGEGRRSTVFDALMGVNDGLDLSFRDQ